MSKPSLSIGFTAIAVLLVASAAHAQATRTWVSGVGSDANPCSRTAPCQTFSGAISKTAAGGEISALDPGGFGTINITKSITINGDGTLAGILAANTNGVIVNGAGIVVVLRNLSIQGAGTTTGNGVRFLQGSQLVIENCTIAGHAGTGTNGRGVSIETATNTHTTITNTSISNFGGVGVRMSATAGTPTLRLNNVNIQKAAFGVDVLNGIATIADSYISNITNQAVVAEGTSFINVDDAVLSNSGTGVSALGTSTVRIANTAILNNGTGINIAAGATVASFGGNKNAGNGVPGAPNLNIPLQ